MRFILIVLPFVFIGLMVLGGLAFVFAINYLNHSWAREKRAYVLSKVQGYGQMLHLDVESMFWATSFFAFSGNEQLAEAIITRNSICYFGYFVWFGLPRMYKGFMQFYSPHAELPEQLMERGFIPVKSIKFDNRTITITYTRNMSNCTVRLEGIAEVEAVKGILGEGWI